MKRLTMILILNLAACASAPGVRTETIGREYPPRPSDWPIALHANNSAPHGLKVWAEAGKPEGKRIGRLHLNTRPRQDWQVIVSRLRSGARSIGGDAVYVYGGEDYYKVVEASVYRRTDG
jgi:hypothetical protein